MGGGLWGKVMKEMSFLNVLLLLFNKKLINEVSLKIKIRGDMGGFGRQKLCDYNLKDKRKCYVLGAREHHVLLQGTRAHGSSQASVTPVPRYPLTSSGLNHHQAAMWYT